MKSTLFTFAAFAGLATASRQSFHERRQASPDKTNLQFETSADTFTGTNEITFGKALDLNQRLFSINVNKAGDKDVLCEAFSEGKPLGAFFPARGLDFGTAGQLVTRIECDLPKFPVAAGAPSKDATPTSTSSASPSETSGANAPSSTKANGPQITFEFELERGATPKQETFPFTSNAALDVDIKAVAARIVNIVGADSVKVEKVVCTTQKDQSSAKSKDIKSTDKVFFDEGKVVRITQITCSEV